MSKIILATILCFSCGYTFGQTKNFFVIEEYEINGKYFTILCVYNVVYYVYDGVINVGLDEHNHPLTCDTRYKF